MPNPTHGTHEIQHSELDGNTFESMKKQHWWLNGQVQNMLHIQHLQLLIYHVIFSLSPRLSTMRSVSIFVLAYHVNWSPANAFNSCSSNLVVKIVSLIDN
jgi:hypothetical protein